MKNAILVHGKPSKDEYLNKSRHSPSNDHWFPWLSRKLVTNNIHPVAIEVPRPYSPRYDVWKSEFERFDVDDETALVGHSCGGGFLVRWLSENKDVRVGKVVLVAPWMNPDDKSSSDTADFFQFEIDSDMASRTSGLVVFNSNDDMDSIHETVEILKDKIENIDVREFEGYGHFCRGDMGTEEFPELLKEILA